VADKRSTMLVSMALATGCGGSPPPPTAAPASSAEAAEEGPPSAASAAPAAAAAQKPDGSVVTLEGVMPKGTTAGFPKATSTDKACAQSVGLTGQFDKDYEAVAAACGTGTGMKEYVRRVTGKLDAGHRQDTYLLSMAGGFCYRFFAVGDGTIDRLTVRVHRPNGALLSSIKAKDPVAIVDPNEPWCKHHDRDFHIVVEAPGNGTGRYAFGIWARPGTK
jgi:hypothetical protein